MRRSFLLLDHRLWRVIFFGGLLVVGLTITRDYGLYIDEFTNRAFGLTWYHYVENVLVHHAPVAPLATATEHDVIHGPVFEMALAWIEETFVHPSQVPEIVYFRHYATWATFYGGVVCVYLLARRLWASPWLALLASGFLVIHPRVFSHSFYDSVDVSFLVFYTASVYTLVRYLDRRTLSSLCAHAVVCALAIDIRAIGGIIPVLTLVVLALEGVVVRAPDRRLRHAGRIAAFLAILTATTIAFWPYLWTNPWSRALEVIRLTPKIDWNGLVLYFGRNIAAPDLPWHYIPVWMLITTPIAISVLFLVGLVDLLSAAIRRPAWFHGHRPKELVIVAAFVLPVAAVIGMRAVVYDSWRHLFFVYPAMVLLAVSGWRRTLCWLDSHLPPARAAVVKGCAGALIAVNLASAAWFMIENHPFENVYFNRLAGRSMSEVKRRFEMDYWGLSYLRALEYVMKHDARSPIKICRRQGSLLAVNRLMLSPADQARIQAVDLEQADYAITNFRQMLEGYPTLSEYFSVEVGGEKIVGVYRRPPAAK